MTDDILPCPFCGSAPIVDDEMGLIACHNDDCVGPSIHAANSIDEAARFWNTRTSVSAAHDDDDGVDLTTRDLLKPRGNGGIVNTDICFSALLLVGDVDVTESQVDGWNESQKWRAYDWAMRVHLRASDNDDIYLPPWPDFIPRGKLRAPQIVPGGNRHG